MSGERNVSAICMGCGQSWTVICWLFINCYSSTRSKIKSIYPNWFRIIVILVRIGQVNLWISWTKLGWVAGEAARGYWRGAAIAISDRQLEPESDKTGSHDARMMLALWQTDDWRATDRYESGLSLRMGKFAWADGRRTAECCLPMSYVDSISYCLRLGHAPKLHLERVHSAAVWSAGATWLAWNATCFDLISALRLDHWPSRLKIGVDKWPSDVRQCPIN